MRAARLALAALLAALVAFAIGAASRAPVALEPAGEAAIRLSWRTSSEPIEHCRTASAEELAQLPVHMRRTEICERRLAAFRLVASLDGSRVIDEAVEPEGAQRDRPAYVLRELRVAPGEHVLALRLTPEREGIAAPRPLSASFALAPGEVALVTLDAAHAEFELRRP